jgi:RES domain-containing protein
MTPLPAALGGGAGSLVAWRLERELHLPTWQTAEGAFRVGGRWSSAGRRVLYASLDPATAILEVAVHTGFNTLDALPHALLQLAIEPAAEVHVLHADEVPNPHWLRPGTVSVNQQKFGDGWLARHPLLVLPSAVSAHSWNLLIDVVGAAGRFKLIAQERFALDPRLTLVKPLTTFALDPPLPPAAPG